MNAPLRRDQVPFTPQHEVIVIGSGFAGLCMGIQLQEAGISNFVILEKDAVLGGTWRVNNYPGCACDVPSHLYSFSFAQNPDWSRKYPRQGELLAYTLKVVADYGLAKYLRLNTAILGADYDEAGGYWRVKTSQGELTTKSLVTGLGALNRPVYPKIKGLETFQGKTFHSAEWDHDYDLSGKRVAVIGTGASAIQFVPEIVPKVKHLSLFQRTPPWILPRPDRAINSVEKWLMRHFKPTQWLYRGTIYATHEFRALGFVVNPKLMKFPQAQALAHIKKQIPNNPVLREKLTPKYTFGCKRVLVMNDYYPALTQKHVAVVTDAAVEVRANSIISSAGVETPIDAIIYGTGFDVGSVLGPIKIRGIGGQDLGEKWQREGTEAYLGMTVAGYPNFFMLTGPNTGLGHSSMVYMIESAVNYALAAIKTLRQQQLHSVEVKPEVQASYNVDLQNRLNKSVWQSGCQSWYLGANGKNHTLWPGFTFQYRNATKKFDAVNYTLRAQPALAVN